MTCGQWRDSKVINFVTSSKDLAVGCTKRQIGAKKLKFACPNVVLLCDQTMFGVDKGDQMRMHGGGFARKAHFEKWCKKAFFAVMDCMLSNALVAWNLLCAEHRSGRRPSKRHEFHTWVAECMLTCKDASILPRSPEQMRDARAGMCHGRQMHRPVQEPQRSRCVACRLDCNCERKGGTGVVENTCCCTVPDCERSGHRHQLLALPKKDAQRHGLREHNMLRNASL